MSLVFIVSAISSLDVLNMFPSAEPRAFTEVNEKDVCFHPLLQLSLWAMMAFYELWKIILNKQYYFWLCILCLFFPLSLAFLRSHGDSWD
jgi:hypothetical protein